MEVHVSISERSSGDCVSTDTNRCNGTDLVEKFIEKTLHNVAVQITDVERSGLEVSSGCNLGLHGLLNSLDFFVFFFSEFKVLEARLKEEL